MKMVEASIGVIEGQLIVLKQLTADGEREVQSGTEKEMVRTCTGLIHRAAAEIEKEILKHD